MAVAVAAPILRLTSGPSAGKVFELRTVLRIGRHPFNEMSLGDPGVSRYHCWILLRDGAHEIEDLASVNGTFVNGERLRTRRLLKTGDTVRIGDTEFVFKEVG